MNDILEELDMLFKKINDIQKLVSSSKTLTLDELKQVCDSSLQMVSIFRYEDFSYTMTYCNQSAYEFLGTTEAETNKLGFKYILKLVHPENISVVYNIIKFFADKDNSNKVFSHTYYIKTKNGWEWTYACVKPAILNDSGEAKYLLGVGCSVDELLKSKKQVNSFKKNIGFLEENAEKYLELSMREKEVLKLICEEYTSKEIADKLFLSSLTVDTHRKNLIEKLGVKSSIGLVKYALLFDLL
ncbi:MAG: helix-turn-helix transcriptional regulator [Chitinophagales bacterium]